MTVMQILFLVVGAVTLFSALMVVSVRRMMHAALWLVLSLMGVAILFATLEAGFFAVVQVMVYIGAIAILIIFAVMLTRRALNMDEPGLLRGWWLAGVAVVGIFAGLVLAFTRWDQFMTPLPGVSPDPGILVQMGKDLVDPLKYSIPFEVSSVLLLAALVGAVYVALERKGGKA
jgi:NADH-quinone oxidoreductase subunit J